MESLTSFTALRTRIRQAAADTGVEAYYVGGFVRDQLLGRASKDIDIVVVADQAETLLNAVANRCHWAPPIIVGQFGTGQVHGNGFFVEAVRARSESYVPGSRKPEVQPGTLEDDIWRRDFTVNTLCLTMDGELRDLTGRGVDDLRAGILRTPLDPVLTFSEDPLRMLRGARFAASLGFTLAPETVAGMRTVADRISIISAERIAEELRRILLAPKPSLGFEVLREAGVLEHILPEFAAMVGMTQNDYHKYDVWGHTMAAVDLASPADLLTRTSALMHDVGKVCTRSADADERVHFYEHETVGAQMAADILNRLRFPTDFVKDVETIVSLHMRPMLYEPAMADRGVRKLIADIGTLRDPLLAVARADMGASARPRIDLIDDLAARMHALDVQGLIARKEPVLDGGTVMRILGVAPGPVVGQALAALEEARVAGDFAAGDTEAAITWLSARKERFAPGFTL